MIKPFEKLDSQSLSDIKKVYEISKTPFITFLRFVSSQVLSLLYCGEGE